MLRIDDGDIPAARGIGQAQARAGQPLIEEPDAPGVAAGGLLADKRFDRAGAGRQKQPLEHGQVETLVFEGKGHVPFERGVRRVAGRHDPPSPLLPDPVMRAGRGQGAGQRRLQPVGVDQGAVSRGRSLLRKAPFLKDRHRS